MKYHLLFIFLTGNLATQGQQPTMVSIPAGSYTLGCTPTQQPCTADNVAHTVTLDSFFLGAHEVTQAEYLAILGSNPAANMGCTNCPVENVSWYDALQYCNRLSQQAGLIPCYYADAGLSVVFDGNAGLVFWNTEANGYRLPTEAEWEYAARNASADDFTYAGSNSAADVAWLADNSGGSTRPAGQRAPNTLGLYDMTGNVAEWVWDTYAAFSADPVCNPLGPVAGSNRVLRGGDYQSDATAARLALRVAAAPGTSNGRTGFRVCSDQAPALTLPACVSMLTTPANNATAVALTSLIEWAAATNATGYRISLGITPGGMELINDLNLGDTLRYDYPGCLPQNTIIHVTITPYNAAGAATGCAGFSFMTGSGVPDMVLVPGGTINLGGVNPTTPVTIDSFWIGRYEVTQCEWESVIGNWGFGFPNCGGDCPTENLSWYDVATFCNRLSLQQGLEPVYYFDAGFTQVFDSLVEIGSTYVDIFWKPGANGYRLPTDAEWEYAARGASNSPNYFYVGSDNVDAVGWYNENSGSTTQSIGQKQPNILDLYDMSGNVWEWCWDWYYGGFPSGNVNPTGPAGGLHRVRRGGGVNYSANALTIANRPASTPGLRINYNGFRLSRSLPTIPACVTTLTQPLNNATSVPLTTNIAWQVVADATGYRISLGTNPGGTDLVNNEDLGDTLLYNPTGCLPANTTIYVNITPYNADGDAVGCGEFLFTTATGYPNNPTPPVGMVYVPGGCFEMGCTPEQMGCISNESPVHIVELDGFFIGQYEVTQSQWESVMGNWSFYFGNCGSDCPAEAVSFYDAATFCNRLSLQEGLEPVYYFDAAYMQVFDTLLGSTSPPIPNIEIYADWSKKGYRLPTEAEWEYAARGAGVEPQMLYSGSSFALLVGWCNVNSMNTTHPVGGKQPNGLGLFDMSGNVWEWCWDRFSASYYSSSPSNNPKGPSESTGSTVRVCRGGSWFYAPTYMRVARRSGLQPGARINGGNSNGFRLARSLSSANTIGCIPTLLTPTPNTTAVHVTTNIAWEAAANATGYRISLGTTPGGTDLVNDQDLGDTLRYDYPGCFPQNTTIHVTIIPYNTAGSAMGCAEFSFTTGIGVPDMVLVPGGTINLGGVNVMIDSFWIGRYEVTQCEWESVMGSNPSFFTTCGGDCPVETVRWYDAVTFCNRLSLQRGLEPVYYFDAGFTQVFDSLVSSIEVYVDIYWKPNAKGYRLPTEVEWEYAARGATNSPNYPYAGSDSLDWVGWHIGNSQVSYIPSWNGRGTHPSGRKMPNGLGLYDMSGNVSEWCWDWFMLTYPSGQNNPIGPIGGLYRLSRGGSWGSSFCPMFCQVASRTHSPPSGRSHNSGFRIVFVP